MEKVAAYRQLIMDRLKHYAQFKPAYGDVDMELIFDKEHDHYQ